MTFAILFWTLHANCLLAFVLSFRWLKRKSACNDFGKEANCGVQVSAKEQNDDGIEEAEQSEKDEDDKDHRSSKRRRCSENTKDATTKAMVKEDEEEEYIRF